LVGVASGVEQSYGYRELVPNGLSLRGVAFGREMHLPRVRDMMQRHFASLMQGRLRVQIAAEFPLREAAKAHEYAESGRPFGRVLMLP
jgi:NADPH:quinone reductase-like Zn-dependent oxidoreductase